MLKNTHRLWRAYLRGALLVCWLGYGGLGWAHAEWRKLEAPVGDAAQRYIDLTSMKQAGPMSIYRQVQVLTNLDGHKHQQGLGSRVQWVEYDCMQPRRRLLREIGYSQPWAKGDGISLPTAPPSDWQTVVGQPSELAVITLICPGGADN